MSIYIIKNIFEPSLHDFYIGSCKDMRRRKNEHKSHCYNENCKEYNYKLYQFIRANGGWDNFVMEEIENCNTERLYQVEQEYIDKLNPSLNSQRAYCSKEQRKEDMKGYKKEFRIKYKDKINKKQKEKITCECGSIYTRTHKARHFKSIKHKSHIQNKKS